MTKKEEGRLALAMILSEMPYGWEDKVSRLISEDPGLFSELGEAKEEYLSHALAEGDVSALESAKLDGIITQTNASDFFRNAVNYGAEAGAVRWFANNFQFPLEEAEAIFDGMQDPSLEASIAMVRAFRLDRARRADLFYEVKAKLRWANAEIAKLPHEALTANLLLAYAKEVQLLDPSRRGIAPEKAQRKAAWLEESLREAGWLLDDYATKYGEESLMKDFSAASREEELSVRALLLAYRKTA